MKKFVYASLLLLLAAKASSQKVESIYFNLYTDSLKKVVHNYINVDGKLSNGKYAPLDSKQIILSSSYGKWEGNDLIIDPSYKQDSVVVTAVLKGDASVTKTVTIYMKRNLAPERLKTEQEVLDRLSRPRKKS